MRVLTQNTSRRAALRAFISRTAAEIADLFLRASNTLVEARMQRALIEAELYRNRYRHTSKNDDDLPIVPSASQHGEAS